MPYYLFGTTTPVDVTTFPAIGMPPTETLKEALDNAFTCKIQRQGSVFFWIKDTAGSIVLDNAAIEERYKLKMAGLRYV